MRDHYDLINDRLESLELTRECHVTNDRLDSLELTRECHDKRLAFLERQSEMLLDQLADLQSELAKKDPLP